MSADTEILFKNLLQRLRPAFKAEGFRASGQNFVLESPECWVIINFQKSRWSSHDETTFYVNVAAAAKRWIGVEGKPSPKAPRYYSCDWQWRAEQLGPDETINSWTLRDENSLMATYTYLSALFHKYVFPASRCMTRESQLIEFTAGFEYPQLKTRCVIFAETNRLEELRQAVAALIQKFGSGPAAKNVASHIELLRTQYSEAMRAIEP